MAELSKKPTGLAIHRQGRKFTFSWKIGAKDYDDGQKVAYNLGYPKNKVMTYMKNVGTRTTSKSIKIDESKYYPNKKKKLNRVQFGVAGNRDGSKYTWSNFSEKEFILKVPRNAKAYVADSDSADNRAVFGWKVVTSDTSERYFVDVEWESVLIRNCTFKATEGKKAFAKATAKVGTKKTGTSKNATGSVTITEDSSDIYDLKNNSYTRWFRVRARGPRGHSKKWAYTRYVHGQPGITKNVNPQVKVLAAGYEVTVQWSSVRSTKKPIDKMIVQYVKATPDGVNLGYTSDSGWTDARTIAPKDGTDAAHFTVDGLLTEDQCLYVRINTYHDGYVTNGEPILALAGPLKRPTISSLSYNPNTNKVDISISNTSSVPGAFYVIVATTASNMFPAHWDIKWPNIIGIIPAGSTSATGVKCPPSFPDSDNIIGVYSVVGTYEAKDAISFTTYNINQLAYSDVTWQSGAVLNKPTNVTAVQAEGKEDTIRVSWDWSWDEATGAELSWSDHDDAWESTDEPSKYTVTTINSSHWNISNVEVGKKWYVRVRFYKTEGDVTIYGMWSDIVTCDLSKAPNIPVLELSAEAVAVGGEFVATWVYTTNDGTPQAYASICQATIENGIVTYGNEVANAQTEQRVVLNVDELMANHEWSMGNIYYLCVKVRSESGHDSDGWSDPVPIRLVEPLECIITSTSLVEEEIEVNPRDFTGNPVAFTTEMDEDFSKLEIALSPIQLGEGTPSPSNVRPIVGHSEVEVVCKGRNLLDPSKFTKNVQTSESFIDDDLITMKWTNGAVQFYGKQVFPPGTYTVHAIGTNTADVLVGIYNSSTGAAIQNLYMNVSRTFTSPAPFIVALYGYYLSANPSSVFRLQLEEGSTANDYERYQDPKITNQDFSVSLTPTVIDETPYLFKQTGDVRGDRESLELVGGTVNWNQLADVLPNATRNGLVYSTSNGKISISGTVQGAPAYGQFALCKDIQWQRDGRKYLVLLSQPLDVGISGFNHTTRSAFFFTSTTGTPWVGYVNLHVEENETVNISNLSVQIFDLTSFFGNSATADYVYSLEQANAGAGIAWLKKYFPDLFVYNAYDTGTLKSVKPTAHVTRGKNQWDEEWANGGIDINTGQNFNDGSIIRSKNYTRVAQGASYYCNIGAIQFFYDADKNYLGYYSNGSPSVFTPPTGCAYMRFRAASAYGATYKNDICINISDPDINGKYFPADHHTYPISELELRGIPKLVDGELRFDGDTRKADGNVGRKYGVVDLGTLPWTMNATGQFFALLSPYGVSDSSGASLMCSKYLGGNAYGGSADKVICVYGSSHNVWVKDSSYSDAATFKTAMSGVYLVYEKATPTTETAEPFTDPQEVSIYGTEEFVSSNGVPVGNKTTYKTRDIFGGKIDLVSGVLTVDKVSLLFDGTETQWIEYPSYETQLCYLRYCFHNKIPKYILQPNWGISNYMQCVTNILSGTITAGQLSNSTANAKENLYVSYPSGVASLSAWKTYLASHPLQLVYKLETPLTYQLTPHEIETLIGSNVVTTEDGNLTVRIAESTTLQQVLTELPLTVTVEGAGDDGQTRVAIQRAQAFYLDRPDESQRTGYLDETVLLEEQAGEAEMEFDVGDDSFLGTLDDGAEYKIVATISDAFGQRATIEPEPEFIVRWDHQAVVPEATVVADQDEQIVKITPTVPQGADVLDTDVIDIYRLSIDKPKLIYENAKIGETYVDPYPTLGEYGGHRVVFRTREGDTTTTDKEMAWTDYHERIDTMYNIIEFGNDRLDLIYNMKINSSWEKDFSQIAYLDGTIIGDWKAGVKRSGDISSVLITTMDQDMLQRLRRLAEYEGVCHVRTREGSSYAANVDVSINQDMGQNVQIAEISLTVNRIDSEGLDGMTLEDWEEGR